jgi:hypothetical protein
LTTHAWLPAPAAARGKLDTLNMEFNKITNQVKELRKASRGF